MWRISAKGVSDVPVSLGDIVADQESSADESLFSPHGDELVTWGGRRVKFWSLRLPELARKVQLAAGRNFTWNEWLRSFPGQEYAKLFLQLPVDVSVVSNILEEAHLELLRHDITGARHLYETAMSLGKAPRQYGCERGGRRLSAIKMRPGSGEYRDTRALFVSRRAISKAAV